MGLLYSKWPHRTHKLNNKNSSPQSRNRVEKYAKNIPKSPNLAKLPDVDSFSKFLDLIRTLNSADLLVQLVCSVRSFWIQWTHILWQFFGGILDFKSQIPVARRAKLKTIVAAYDSPYNFTYKSDLAFFICSLLYFEVLYNPL